MPASGWVTLNSFILRFWVRLKHQLQNGSYVFAAFGPWIKLGITIRVILTIPPVDLKWKDIEVYLKIHTLGNCQNNLWNLVLIWLSREILCCAWPITKCFHWSWCWWFCDNCGIGFNSRFAFNSWWIFELLKAFFYLPFLIAVEQQLHQTPWIKTAVHYSACGVLPSWNCL